MKEINELYMAGLVLVPHRQWLPRSMMRLTVDWVCYRIMIASICDENLSINQSPLIPRRRDAACKLVTAPSYTTQFHFPTKWSPAQFSQNWSPGRPNCDTLNDLKLRRTCFVAGTGAGNGDASGMPQGIWLICLWYVPRILSSCRSFQIIPALSVIATQVPRQRLE